MATIRPTDEGVSSKGSFNEENGEKVPEALEKESPEEELVDKASWKVRSVIFVFLLLYSLGGAWIFQLLEKTPEIDALKLHQSKISSGRLKLLAVLENLKDESKASDSENNRTSRRLAAIEAYEKTLDDAVGGNLKMYLDETIEHANIHWGSFLHSFFFTLTVITTIGYGNLVPTTIWGRLFCIQFALIGIPVTLVFIAQTGKVLASFATNVYLRLFGPHRGWRYFNSPNPTNTRKMIGTSVSLTTVTALFFCYIAAGAFLFNATENWGFVNAFYFCFITLTTIGFGDLVPHYSGTEGILFLYIRATYTLWGLAITSMVISLAQNHYAQIWLNAEEKRHSKCKFKLKNKDAEKNDKLVVL